MTFDEIVSDWRTRHKQQFGESADTSEKSIAYILNYPILYALYELYCQRQLDIDSSNIYKAAGKYLDNLLGNYLFTRKVAKSAHVVLTSIDSTPGTVITAGNLLVKAGDVEFVNIEPGTVDAYGVLNLKMQAVNAGIAGNIDAGTLTEIVTPLAGIGTVSNLAVGYGGQDTETDYEYRQRFITAPNGDSYWNMGGLKKALMAVSGVSSVFIQENASNITVHNLPPHSIKIVVDGGDVEEIAAVIYERTPYETTKLGDIEVAVYDPILQDSKSVKFMRPVIVDVKAIAHFEGSVDADALTTYMNIYIDSVPVGGSLSNFKAVNYIRQYVSLEGLKYLDILFERDAVQASYITLDASEKAKAVTV